MAATHGSTAPLLHRFLASEIGFHFWFFPYQPAELMSPQWPPLCAINAGNPLKAETGRLDLNAFIYLNRVNN